MMVGGSLPFILILWRKMEITVDRRPGFLFNLLFLPVNTLSAFLSLIFSLNPAQIYLCFPCLNQRFCCVPCKKHYFQGLEGRLSLFSVSVAAVPPSLSLFYLFFLFLLPVLLDITISAKLRWGTEM